MSFLVIEKISAIEKSVLEMKQKAQVDAETIVKTAKDQAQRSHDEAIETETTKTQTYLADLEKKVTASVEHLLRESDVVLRRARDEAETHVKATTALVIDRIMGN